MVRYNIKKNIQIHTGFLIPLQIFDGEYSDAIENKKGDSLLGERK